MSGAPAPVVILISGRGSNLRAILDETRAGRLPIEICAVISNNPGAEGLQHARAAGVPTETINHRDYTDRAQFDAALMQATRQLLRPLVPEPAHELGQRHGLARCLGHAQLDAGRLLGGVGRRAQDGHVSLALPPGPRSTARRGSPAWRSRG